MNALGTHLGISLRLHFRNKMALLYGYLFPLIFLVAFWAVYRNDPVPLALHVGQFLTVTILGSACFGLPTTIVSERERGVWRRYALMPVGRWLFVVSILLARTVLLLTALGELYAQQLAKRPETEHFMRTHDRGREVEMARRT